eukprot:1968081-Amphidinium_carterae.1
MTWVIRLFTCWCARWRPILGCCHMAPRYTPPLLKGDWRGLWTVLTWSPPDLAAVAVSSLSNQYGDLQALFFRSQEFRSP